MKCFPGYELNSIVLRDERHFVGPMLSHGHNDNSETTCTRGGRRLNNVMNGEGNNYESMCDKRTIIVSLIKSPDIISSTCRQCMQSCCCISHKGGTKKLIPNSYCSGFVFLLYLRGHDSQANDLCVILA